MSLLSLLFPSLSLARKLQAELTTRAVTVGAMPPVQQYTCVVSPQTCDDPRLLHLRCRDITAHFAKRSVRLVVWVITRKQVEAVQEKARDGSPLPAPVISPMAFVTLEDETGTLEST